VPPVRYELGFYIPEDGIHHSHPRGNIRFFMGTSFLRSDIRFLGNNTCNLRAQRNGSVSSFLFRLLP
jgi:hypothetical protein